MTLKLPAILVLPLLLLSGQAITAPRTLINNIYSAHWSVLPLRSSYDPIRVELKKAVLPDNQEALKNYIRAMEFRELVKRSDFSLPVFPTSAGIFNGFPTRDSLSAEDQLVFLYRNLGDQSAEAMILSSIGTQAAVDGYMNKAVYFFRKALMVNTTIQDTPAINRNYFSLIRVYHYTSNLTEAMSYTEDAIRLAKVKKDNYSLAEAYMNQASILISQKKYKEAESLILNKTLPLNFYTLKDYIATLTCYDQLAELYKLQKRFSEAKWFCLQSNMLARKINHPEGVVNSLINLAHVKMSIGDHQLALIDFREAEQLSASNNYSYKLVEIKNELSKVYAMMGNTRAARSALAELSAGRDTLLNTNR